MTDRLSLDDLVPALMGLIRPLWQGRDAEFTAWAAETLKIPTTSSWITITPRVSSGRSAIMLGSQEGGVVFALRADPRLRSLEIRPHVMSRIGESRAMVIEGLPGQGEMLDPIVRLVTRHVAPSVAVNLLAPDLRSEGVERRP